jgi:hypothetical protein
MSQIYPSTFDKGMDQDTSVNKYSNSKYYLAKNLRLITNESLSSGAMSNLKAPSKKLEFPVVVKITYS